MPELLPEDQERYQKLREAALDLQGTLPDSEGAKMLALQELTKAFVSGLLENLTSFDQLQVQIALTGSYLSVYPLFQDAISVSGNKEEIIKAQQALQTQYSALKLVVEEVTTDDILDRLTQPCSDPFFVDLLKNLEVKAWTSQLLRNQAPELTDPQVQTLIGAWGTAVTEFVDDAKQAGGIVPGTTTTIAKFLCIHDQLEALYSELSTSVAANN